METKQLTNVHKTVIEVLENEHLTSFQILSKIKDNTLTLELYGIIDELNNMGILKSYVKQDLKYHYVA